MLEERGITILLVLSAISLLSLYLYQSSIGYEEVDVASLEEHIGEYVEVKALVVRVYEYERSMSLRVVENESYATVFMGFKMNIFPGSTVLVRGRVERYGGGVEIYVKEREDIAVVEEATTFSLREVMENPQFFLGLRIKVYGNLTSLREIENYSWIEISDGLNTTWAHVPGGYCGDPDVCLCGNVSNEILYVTSVNSTCQGISVGEIGEHEGEEVCVHAHVLSYHTTSYYGYLRYGDYSIRVFSRNYPGEGEGYYVGTVVYVEEYGYYELLLG